MPNVLIFNAGVTKIRINSGLKLLMKMQNVVNVLTRKLYQEVTIEEL
jgi:hypothetical protein